MSFANVKTIGGLIAVVVAIVAVASLTLFTLAQLDTKHQDSMVAVTSSAFGIISAIVGAYLGIKITADTNARATDRAGEAAIAQHEAGVLSEKLAAVTDKVDEVVPDDKAAEIKYAGEEAEKEARAVRPRYRHHKI